MIKSFAYVLGLLFLNMFCEKNVEVFKKYLRRIQRSRFITLKPWNLNVNNERTPWRHQNQAKEEVCLINFYFSHICNQKPNAWQIHVGSWKKKVH